MVFQCSRIRKTIFTRSEVKAVAVKIQKIRKTKMSGKITKGDVCITEDGTVVVITRTDVRSDRPDNFGRIHTYATSTVLRSNTAPVGSRYAGKIFRVVCYIDDLLQIGEANGLDLNTRAEIPDSELTEMELLKRRLAQLEAQAVARPRSGIAALEQK